MTAGGPRGVDVHAHAVPRRFLERVEATGFGGVEVARSDGGYVLTFPDGRPLRPVAGIMLDFDDRLEWMDRQGLARQLVAPWLDVHGQELEPRTGQDWVRALNDALAEEVAETGGRVGAQATLHLADGAAAAAELERAVTALQMRGAMIPTSLATGALHDDRYEPLWEAAEALRAPIVLHPPTISPYTSLFDGRPALKGVYGRLIDTTVAATELVLSGVFDRHPDLRLVLVHGGGLLPYQTGRLDREFGARSGLPAMPSEYAGRFFYDTVLMSRHALSLLFDLAGAGQVVIGTDYAAGPKYRNPGTPTDELDRCTEDPFVRESVRFRNADRLYAGRQAGS